MLPAYDLPTAPTQETVNVMTDYGAVSRQCLGALVAPRVVVTASHCVHENGTMTVDRSLVDGDQPIAVQRMFWFPGFKDGPVNTAKAVREGTHAMGTSRSAKGLVSWQFSLRRENRYYLSAPWAKHGDSGGPIYAGSGKNRRIIAVTSGTTSSGVLLARIDVISDLIEKTIAETQRTE